MLMQKTFKTIFSLLIFNLWMSVAFASDVGSLTVEKTEVQVALCEESSLVTEKLQIENWKFKRQLQTRLVDTVNLDFYKDGLVFRIRINTQKNKVEVALKKKVTDLYHSPRYSEQLECEYDQHQEQRKRTCKMSYEISIEQWAERLDESQPENLLSSDQRGWLRELGQVIPTDLRMTDAIESASYTQKMLNYEKMIDIARDQRGHEYIEVSAKVTTDLITSVEAQLLGDLKEKNIQVCDRDMSRLTYRKLMSFFGP